MRNIAVVCMVYIIVVAKVRAQTTGWSSWSNCTATNNCFRRRTFICDAGEGLKCLSVANGAFEQVSVNCDANLECLENVDEMFRASEVSCIQKIFVNRSTLEKSKFRFTLLFCNCTRTVQRYTLLIFVNLTSYSNVVV